MRVEVELILETEVKGARETCLAHVKGQSAPKSSTSTEDLSANCVVTIPQHLCVGGDQRGKCKRERNVVIVHRLVSPFARSQVDDEGGVQHQRGPLIVEQVVHHDVGLGLRSRGRC